MSIELVLPLYRPNEELGYRKIPKPSHTLSFDRSNGFDHIDPGIKKLDHEKAKKKVSFADHKGLSLTRVKTFSASKDPIEIPLNIQEMLNSARRASAVDEDKLVLDFTQPCADYLQFRQRLERCHVCLEHCMLKEKVLAGTIKVKNLSFEKSVKVRITFDTWKSYENVECTYVKSTYPDSEHDTFTFKVILPTNLGPDEHIEFAICYEACGCVYWDSNQGRNYMAVWSSLRSSRDGCNQGRRSSDLGIHFDRYGSPTCSHGIFPDWPSYAAYENVGPYY